MGGKKKKQNKKKQIAQEVENITQINTEGEPNANDQENDNEDELEDERGTKRRFIDDDDDDDDNKPKKSKKKKKQPAPTESTEKKGKKSIRQMKKEKHAQRQAEAQSAAKDQLKSQCITYLSQWKHDRENWKFMKAKQVWLYKNKFSSQLLPDESWPVLLEYFESAKGNIRNMLLTDAHKIIKEMDDWTASQDKDGDNAGDTDQTPEVRKPDPSVYNRARSLIQCLEE
ncbi:uncharacterized protein C7orf50 homolog [Danaus plexippus]|uniref:uncharacterized protein C7orf50 homolog n=1 Tax=Danaus plexippus TaxID=13037 RepID=UPI002AB069A8|nr:uncharacterized protein C7orf50 homolog [Danaus plexippus]